MKSFLLLFLLNLSLSGFSQYADDEFDHGALTLAARETTNEVFVITKDGVKHAGTKFKTPPGYAMSVYLKIDDTKYPRRKLADIIAWQDEHSYNMYYAPFGEDAVRLLKGKINLYLHKIITGSIGKVVHEDIYFLLEKGESKFFMAKFENMETVFSDNPIVLQKYHELYAEDVRKKGGWPRQSTVKQEKSIYVNMITLVKMYNETLGK